MPEIERYNLAGQLRRAAVSIGLNIAEGYGRYHYLERLRFLYIARGIARGSLSETVSALVIAEQLGYCDGEQLEWVRNLKDSIEKNLNGYCRSIRRQEQGIQDLGTHYLAEDPVRYNYYDHNYYDYDDDITAHSVPNRESPIAAQPNTDRPE